MREPNRRSSDAEKRKKSLWSFVLVVPILFENEIVLNRCLNGDEKYFCSRNAKKRREVFFVFRSSALLLVVIDFLVTYLISHSILFELRFQINRSSQFDSRSFVP